MLRRKFLLTPLLVLLLPLVPLAAQDDTPQDPFAPQQAANRHTRGDQAFSITLGYILPVAVDTFASVPGKPAGAYWLPLGGGGGYGALTYSGYLFPDVKLGFQVGGSFSHDVNGNWCYIVPFTFRGTYEFHPAPRLTVPVFLALGMSLTTWKDETKADFIARPGVGVYFDWSAEWSFGFDTSYWIIPQVYPKTPEFNALTHVVDFTLTAEYHF